MSEEFSTTGFIKAIPAMTRKVWPGIWPLIVVVTASLYFGNASLDVLSFSDWAIMHVLIVVGMISLTIWLYNTFERPAVNLAVIALWLLASAFCMLSNWFLRSAGV
jgi:hypothetical protein